MFYFAKFEILRIQWSGLLERTGWNGYSMVCGVRGPNPFGILERASPLLSLFSSLGPRMHCNQASMLRLCCLSRLYTILYYKTVWRTLQELIKSAARSSNWPGSHHHNLRSHWNPTTFEPFNMATRPDKQFQSLGNHDSKSSQTTGKAQFPRTSGTLHVGILVFSDTERKMSTGSWPWSHLQAHGHVAHPLSARSVTWASPNKVVIYIGKTAKIVGYP